MNEEFGRLKSGILITKAGAGDPTVTYPHGVEIALCYGRIDGQKKGLDEKHRLHAHRGVQPVVVGKSRLGRGIDQIGLDAAE